MRVRRLATFATLLVMLLTVGLAPMGVWAAEPVTLVIFYSPTCGHCAEFEERVWPGIEADYGTRLSVQKVDVTNAQGLARLEAEEERLGVRAPEVPVLLVGDTLIYDLNLDRLGERLREALDAALEGAPASGATTPAPSGPDATGGAQGPTLHLAYVEKDGCSDCARAKAVLEVVGQEFPQLQVTTLNVVRDAPLVEAMGAFLGLPETQRLLAPAIYVGTEVLGPEEVTSARVREALQRHAAAGTSPFWEGLEVSEGRSAIVERFRQMGPAALVVAALLDGINPCAFATILFFVSYLAVSRRPRQQLLLVGLTFTAGVFLTYLLVGLGAMRLLALASAFRVVGTALYALMGVGCLVLAGFSVHDYALARQGRLKDMTLNLPGAMRERIKGRIRAASGAAMGAAFLSGMVVSLLELACTGQVYLPTISFVVGIPEMRSAALAYLGLYNIVFISPLVVVLLLAVYGVSATRLQDWFVRHAATTKLLMVVLFVLLGSLLLVQAFAG